MRRCVNCQVPARILCWECARMVLATVVGELAVAAVLWALRG
jgi:hypothetical protein